MTRRQMLMPALLLTLGWLLLAGADLTQLGEAHVVAPLHTLPVELEGFRGVDLELGEAEARVAGATEYLLRRFVDEDGTGFSVYVGFYASQAQGRTIHSPKNCLPGSGWQSLASGASAIPLAGGPVLVNRYLVAHERESALVYYWYQGRGRVEASEYRVKWDLLRDAALTGRTEEALVRIVVPLKRELAHDDEPSDAGPTAGARLSLEAADSVAVRVAARLIVEVDRLLPSVPRVGTSEPESSMPHVPDRARTTTDTPPRPQRSLAQ